MPIPTLSRRHALALMLGSTLQL
ncbi:MAG: hypothetical protein RL748_4095, partial [Pseudomonadota bacterium]